jgi:hypothetical protein
MTVLDAHDTVARTAARAARAVLDERGSSEVARTLARQAVTESLAALGHATDFSDAAPPVRACLSTEQERAWADGSLSAEATLALAERLLALVESVRARSLPKGRALWPVYAVGAALLVAAVVTALRTPRSGDLLIGAPWKASSKLADCHPEVPECAGARTPIFFHTTEEEQPWVEFELETPRTFSNVKVENREDMGLNRAVPLVLEASDDHTTWTEVARREESFSTWSASFAPHTARWVRLRVTRRSQFHLNAVRLYP